MRSAAVITFLFLSCAASSVQSACSSARCGAENAPQVEALRVDLQARCDCEGSAKHKDYVRCVRRQLRKAWDPQRLPKPCARAIRKCEARSTCGRGEAIVCCRERKAGHRPTIKASAARCRRGVVCEALSSVYDACTTDGTCTPKLCTPNIVDRASDVTPIHDPAIFKQDDTYYVYSSSPLLSFYSSKDLRHWSAAGRVFDVLPDWILEHLPNADHIGAPDIARYNGRYVLFYQSHIAPTCNAGIAYATNTTLDPLDPSYAWVDHGLVLRSVPQGNDFLCGDGETFYDAIDPHFFVDADGTPWLAFGSTLGGIKLAQLDPNTLKPLTAPATFTILAARPLLQPDPIIEAPYILHRGGYYYLFLSHNRCCQGADTRYQIRVGRAEMLAGPYYDKDGTSLLEEGGTLLIDADGAMIGTGHNDIFSEGGIDWLVHHGYDSENDYEPVLNIRAILWDADGWPSVCRTQAP